MTSRRTLLKGTLFGSAAALLPTAASASGGGSILQLPAPAGPYPVGMQKVHLTDPARTDPWVGGVRELMLTVLYPARSVRGFSRAPQLTPDEAAVFAEYAPGRHPGLPEPGVVDWGAVLTHGYVGAPPLPGRRPVLVYSPGGGDSRTLGTTLAEDLASHGRVVVLVDHPGDASQVELPTGLRTTVLIGPPDPATFRTMVDTRRVRPGQPLRGLTPALGTALIGKERCGRRTPTGYRSTPPWGGKSCGRRLTSC
ncbi:hypothetical protein [Streptomyces sp. AC550_RSS872]|uniref:alpha/beta hydrolase n=1 Tax=Streptomyces sp. AC550_RSS872 TaxID=2823689 RepID=UPI0020B7855C|nr:hypothetical protein [Streptomyces sp. AC550_RSS872]